jgi:wyosine [tRNA(Phe)-imidazoG37] synthetase (radical SAM superfamily)
VYCQLGRTTHLRTRRERFYPRDDVLAEIAAATDRDSPDYVTFVGDGEPTLCKDLGWLIRECRRRWPIKVAVITNGSLLGSEDVREELLEADVVMPSLDAGRPETFRAVDRPHRRLFYPNVLEGQARFREAFHGQLWLEVMLVRDLNDTDEELSAIAAAVPALRPDRVYVMTPSRPPAEPWVRAPEPEAILNAQRLLGGAVAIATPESGEFGLQEYATASKAIVEIGSRHPLQTEQAESIARRYGEAGLVERMIAAGELVRVRHGGRGYVLPGHFVRGTPRNTSPEE